MDRDLIQNRNKQPTMEEIDQHFSESAKRLWKELFAFLDAHYSPRSEITYSGCSAKPGWNVKLRSGGRALCTLYPARDGFTVLVVLDETRCELLATMLAQCGDAVRAAFGQFAPMNGSKWLMVDVADDRSLRDVERLLQLRTQR